MVLATGATPSWALATRTVLVVGDSLAAEYGLRRGSGWVALLARRVAAGRPQYSLVNASISGDTSAGGRTRLPALLVAHRPAIVILELGANDGLRGLRLDALRENLRAMIRAARAAGARVLLVGIHVPPNYGRDYDQRLYATYGELARIEHVALTPFLLNGFAERLELFQADRIHPVEAAQPRIVDNVWPALAPLLAADGWHP